MTETRIAGAPEPRAGERGQALAVFTGGLVAFLVAAGFVLDGGLAFVNRRDAQNAADLGALAGTQIVAEFHIEGTGTGSDVFAAIDATVRENGCTPGGDTHCTWAAEYVRPTTDYDTVVVGAVSDGGAIPPIAQGVEVHVARAPLTYFLRIVGQDDWDVSADATAVTSGLQGIGEGILLPIAFDPGLQLIPGSRYIFSEEKDAPGNFSWLSWYDINNAVETEENVCHPRNPAYSFPVYVPGAPGKKNKSGIRDCLDGYVGEIVYVPLWDDCALGPGVTENGSHVNFCIVGVAAFTFEGYFSNPAIDDVWGTLVGISHDVSVPANWSGPPCQHGTPGCNSATNYLGLIR